MPEAANTIRPSHPMPLTRIAVDAVAGVMLAISRDGLVVDANQMACARLEYSLEELIGMPISAIAIDWSTVHWPVQFDELRREAKMTSETGFRTKDGRRLHVEVTTTYFEGDGSEYCCCFAQPIGERKQAENILRLQHDALARIASTTGILNDTLDDLCKEVEQMVPGIFATIMLIDPADGCLRFEAAPSLLPEVRAALEPLRPGETAGSCGSAAHLKRQVFVDDTREDPHWQQLQHVVEKFDLLACWSLPIFDERNQVLGTFALTQQKVAKPSDFQRQVLESAAHMASLAIRRKRFEEQLQFAHAELAHISRLHTMGEMASSLAHELNQPLAAIANHASMLKRRVVADCSTTNPVQEHASAIRDLALRAGAIITSIRNMARKVDPSRKRASLNSLVQKSLILLEPELRQKGICLQKQLADDIPTMVLDPVQIQQVLINLVRNAIEAMRDLDRDARRIRITTSVSKEDTVILRVTDSGPGLAPDMANRIFAPFETTKPDGLGMGLTICRSIAEAHSGSLVAELQPDHGIGACFCLTLPISVTDGRYKGRRADRKTDLNDT